MIISFLDGSKIVEAGVGKVIFHELRKVIHAAESVEFYFYATSEFMLECEWISRKLQVSYPEKHITRSVVVGEKSELIFPHCRFDRCIRIDRQKNVDIWRWMVDQADYVVTYMHPRLCSSRARLTTWNYVQRTKAERCFNFASEDAWHHVCEQIPRLVEWQRETFSRKLQGESVSGIADTLQISRSTVRQYEVAAQNSLVKMSYTPEDSNRTCAILGFRAMSIDMEQGNQLYEAIRYLVQECHVNHFIVQHAVKSRIYPIMQLLDSINRFYTSAIEISTVLSDNQNEAGYRVHIDSGRVDRGLKEREAMIDRADIVLCAIDNTYGSGLNYARNKHVPVINLAKGNI